MAFGITLYLTSTDRTNNTNPISVSNAFTFPIDLGSVAIPASGNTLSTAVHIYGKNTGTTTVSAITAQPTPGTLSGHADFSSIIDLAPDSGGTAGTWGADGASVSLVPGNLASGATFDFWVRANVPNTASPAGTTANYPVAEVSLTLNDLG